ncbi:MAG: ATP-binding protein involved in chromosome partitioning [Methanolobus sp.]|jgi:ATP-binding protein involved in chromosome partitioning|uniref:Mrp/NBP35 family ATP-binding protein n=1 Tax=Methanolobus sp. TaxID=1874737 RepID=UPI0024AC4EDF|nr:Mrp/NBP35 family ATP-binding protein [Methanolobus sp.]MDI3486994.1 ATP-binding protein involved in chromosome partitioning [Methanolobus sp.]MDK2832261.1 ATP-binding protein involved in chromosome partitioning [Methanolobus sp.]MDK2939131.1 ATP-binding protein involved in chromosome partitioning [Methanolobus sp.]
MTQNIQSTEDLLKKPEVPKLVRNMRAIKKKIMVMSGKGGVGKSTVAANLAARLAERGSKVGLLDADIHGPSIPKMFGIEDVKPEVDENGIVPISVTENLVVMSVALLLEDKDAPVIWRGPAKMAAIKQFLEDVSWGNLDYLIVDLPPGTGDEPLSIAQLIEKMEGAVVVTTPQDVALVSVRKSIKFAEILKVPVIGIVENMAGIICPHCEEKIDIFGRGGVEKAAKDFNVNVLGELPMDPKIAEIEDSGKVHTDINEEMLWGKEFAAIVDSVEGFKK